MELALWVLAGWGTLTVLAVLGATAVCRSGHVEDVARGFADDRPESRREVTHG